MRQLDPADSRCSTAEYQVLTADDLRFAARVGRSIAAARVAIEWTQQDLADHIGVCRVMVSRYERGTVLPGLLTFRLLCRHLGLKPGVLLRAGAPKPRGARPLSPAPQAALTTPRGAS